MKHIGRLLLLAALVWAAPAVAQNPPPQAPSFSVLGGYVPISVTSTSAPTALPAALVPFNAVTVYNTGSKDAYFALGGSTVAATTASTKVTAGTFLTVWTSGAYIATITGGSDT